MKRSFSLWQLAGFAATSLLGTLLHFLYEWTGESTLAAPFSGVNESTWEHMKLLYFPLLIFALIQSRFFREYENFRCVKSVGILTGLVLIPVLFYTYNGVFGRSPDFVNIGIFFVSAAVVFILETKLIKNGFRCHFPKAAFILIILIGVLFVLYTFMPPHLPVFRDPVTGEYGIE